jgi:hypothetical protein
MEPTGPPPGWVQANFPPLVRRRPGARRAAIGGSPRPTTLRTKTRASERRIALPTECINSLKSHRERQEEERTATKVGGKDSGLIFTSTTSGPLDPPT